SPPNKLQFELPERVRPLRRKRRRKSRARRNPSEECSLLSVEVLLKPKRDRGRNRTVNRGEMLRSPTRLRSLTARVERVRPHPVPPPLLNPSSCRPVHRASLAARAAAAAARKI
ncbi:hypothetical protein PFISCL1PPCAC_9601, partial [Pristionchus fissidentatus]